MEKSHTGDLHFLLQSYFEFLCSEDFLQWFSNLSLSQNFISHCYQTVC